MNPTLKPIYDAIVKFIDKDGDEQTQNWGGMNNYLFGWPKGEIERRIVEDGGKVINIDISPVIGYAVEIPEVKGHKDLFIYDTNFNLIKSM